MDAAGFRFSLPVADARASGDEDALLTALTRMEQNGMVFSDEVNEARNA